MTLSLELKFGDNVTDLVIYVVMELIGGGGGGRGGGKGREF